MATSVVAASRWRLAGQARLCKSRPWSLQSGGSCSERDSLELYSPKGLFHRKDFVCDLYLNVWTPKTLSKEQKSFFEQMKNDEHFKPSPDKNDKSFFEKVKDMFS